MNCLFFDVLCCNLINGKGSIRMKTLVLFVAIGFGFVQVTEDEYVL